MKSYIHTSSCTYWQSSCLFLFKLYLRWKYGLYTYMYISIRASIFTACIDASPLGCPKLSKIMAILCYVRCLFQVHQSTKPIPHGYTRTTNTSIYFIATRVTPADNNFANNLFHFHNDLLVTYFSLIRRTDGLQDGAKNV